MGFLSRLLHDDGSAGRTLSPATEMSRGNGDSAETRAIRAQHKPHRDAARRHYARTGDSSRMWAAKDAETAAVRSNRRTGR